MNPKHLLICTALFSLPTFLLAEEESIRLSFSNQSLGKGVELLEENGNELLRITAGEGQKGNFLLLDIIEPAVTGEAFAVTGEVRCMGVAPAGFLEMWTHLPAKKGGREIASSFFSRTMSQSGPMQNLIGDQAWRDFRLPAYVNDGSERIPLKLTLNANLPGAGVVEVRDLRLIPTLPVAAAGGFRAGFLVLISIFTLLGIGALIGVLIFLVKRKKVANELSRIRNLDSV